MTDSTPATPDPADSTPTDITVGGSIEVNAEGQVASDAPVVQGDPAAPTNINPGTGQPYPPMGVPLDQPGTDVVSDNPEDVPGDNVYMGLVWPNLTKDQAMQIRDAALAATGELVSYSVTFSTPIDG